MTDLAARRKISNLQSDRNLKQLVNIVDTLILDSGSALTAFDILSRHSPADYSCLSCDVLPPGQTADVHDYKRLTRMQMRSFTNQKGHKRFVHIDHRGKDPASFILKMIRKDTKDPNIIDDTNGLRLVFASKDDMYAFLETAIRTCSGHLGSMATFSEIYDTISKKDNFRTTNKGSSSQLEIAKIHFWLSGMKFEFQMHTFRTFLDYRYHDTTGFETYRIRRLFDSGVARLLFPSDIYGFDVDELRDSLIAQAQANVRQTSFEIPPERRQGGIRQIRYSFRDLERDAFQLYQQIQPYPDYIVAVGDNGMKLATEINSLFNNQIPIVFYDKKIPDLFPQVSGRILIVDDIAHGQHLQTVYNQYAQDTNNQVQLAVLALRAGEDNQFNIDYFARSIREDEWLTYEWETPNEDIAAYASAHVVVWREYGGNLQIFALQEPVSQGGKYKLPGGGKNPADRSLIQTAIRELVEEIGLQVESADLEHICSSKIPKPNPQGVIRDLFFDTFAVVWDGHTELQALEPEEYEKGIWVSVDDFMKNSKYDSYRQGVSAFMKNRQP